MHNKQLKVAITSEGLRVSLQYNHFDIYWIIFLNVDTHFYNFINWME